MAVHFQKGDYGKQIIRRTLKDQDGAVVDISAADSRSFILVDPDGNTSTLTAAFTNSGSDGKIQYTFADSVLDEGGPWKFRFKIEDSSTWEINTPWEDLMIGDN